MEIMQLDTLFERPYSVMHVEEIDNSRLLQSLITYGQLRPIIINETREIVDGMRLLKCLTVLGRKEALVRTIGAQDDYHILTAYLQINLSHAEIDVIAFAEMLDKMQKAEMSLNTIARITCHDLSEVKDIIKLLTFKWSDFERAQDETSQLALL